MSLLRRCLIEVRSRDGSLEDLDALAILLAVGAPERGAAVPCTRLPGRTGEGEERASSVSVSPHAARVESMENVI